ncbi:MAG: hypothetical protein HOM21_07455 [Halobacteriovoraceae bacterium]|nr:hypothetical protein [Halobacteriovoraceae bacterium]
MSIYKNYFLATLNAAWVILFTVGIIGYALRLNGILDYSQNINIFNDLLMTLGISFGIVLLIFAWYPSFILCENHLLISRSFFFFKINNRIKISDIKTINKKWGFIKTKSRIIFFNESILRSEFNEKDFLANRKYTLGNFPSDIDIFFEEINRKITSTN